MDSVVCRETTGHSTRKYLTAVLIPVCFSSVNGQCRMSRDDGPQYEKIPDSGTTTPHVSLPFNCVEQLFLFE